MWTSWSCLQCSILGLFLERTLTWRGLKCAVLTRKGAKNRSGDCSFLVINAISAAVERQQKGCPWGPGPRERGWSSSGAGAGGNVMIFLFPIYFSFLSGAEAGALAQQYLDRGLLVPDHVITRVMMAELEKRREQHWLLDGECRVGSQPLGDIPRSVFKHMVGTKTALAGEGTELQNPKQNPKMVWVGRDLKAHPIPSPAMGRDTSTTPVQAALVGMASPDFSHLFSRSRGILHSFSGTETNKIWPYVYSLLCSCCVPQQNDSSP
uniref:Uncharacterized protein n=1 Tax=Zonotrichia albicollis TaxID=44394 RepID=A0A8D2MX27_ZONAL